jgi:hypothetical protein
VRAPGGASGGLAPGRAPTPLEHAKARGYAAMVRLMEP